MIIFIKNVIIFTIFMISAQNLPVQYYVYFLLPILLWRYALTPVNLWFQVMEMLKNDKKIFWLNLEILCYIMGSICLVRPIRVKKIVSLNSES